MEQCGRSACPYIVDNRDQKMAVDDKNTFNYVIILSHPKEGNKKH